MRKLNIFLVIGMLVSFLAHAAMGGMQLAGGGTDSLKLVAWIMVGFICAHVAVSAVLTVQTLKACKKSGAPYFRNNLGFWARRASGLAIVVPLIMHLVIFSASGSGAYRLKAFTTGRLISQILLVAAIALHLLINIKPMLISMGVKDLKAFRNDILLVLSVLLLLFALAFLIYYMRWMAF